MKSSAETVNVEGEAPGLAVEPVGITIEDDDIAVELEVSPVQVPEEGGEAEVVVTGTINHPFINAPVSLTVSLDVVGSDLPGEAPGGALARDPGRRLRRGGRRAARHPHDGQKAGDGDVHPEPGGRHRPTRTTARRCWWWGPRRRLW